MVIEINHFAVFGRFAVVTRGFNGTLLALRDLSVFMVRGDMRRGTLLNLAGSYRLSYSMSGLLTHRFL